MTQQEEKFKIPEWCVQKFFFDLFHCLVFRASESSVFPQSILEVFKENKLVEKIKIGARVCVTFGRNENMVDIGLQHQSISRQHAAIIHHRSGNIQVRKPKVSGFDFQSWFCR